MSSFETRSNNFLCFALKTILGLAFVFSFFSGSAIADDRKGEGQKLNEEIKKGATELINGANDPKSLKKLDTTPKTKGEAGEVERFLKEVMNNAISFRQNYQAELDAIGWDNLLSTERLKQDSSLEKSKIIVKKGKEAVEKYKKQFFAMKENVIKDVDKLNVSPEIKQVIKTNLEKGMKNSFSRSKGIWILEAQIVNELGNIITLLDSRKGKWRIQNNQLVFDDGKDVEAFNSYLNKAQKLAAKQEALQKQNFDEAKKSLNSI